MDHKTTKIVSIIALKTWKAAYKWNPIQDELYYTSVHAIFSQFLFGQQRLILFYWCFNSYLSTNRFGWVSRRNLK